MFRKNILIILCPTLQLVNSLKSTDFCRKTETKKSCMAFNCGTKYCVYYKSSCKNLISWGILMKKYAKEPTVYKNFLSNIKNCEKDNYKNQWSHRFSFG